MTRQAFTDIVWDYYAKHGRDLPWRKPNTDYSFDPYKILVSEIMLQQTQVSRVIPKFEVWVKAFPSTTTLAEAPLSQVLEMWSGLGYNRRAKFLHEAAKYIENEHRGSLPVREEELRKLPGVGNNTAGAIMAYAFNEPTVFIETNIRTAYIFHFFHGKEGVGDVELLPHIAATVDKENPREWYWALMDYGSYIKRTEGNYSKASKHHAKQSRFEGSKRQVRGKILKELIARPGQTSKSLSKNIIDDRLPAVLYDLIAEGLVKNENNCFYLAD